jgi:hypothetical protein
MYIEMHSPNRQMPLANIESICFLKTDPSRDFDLIIPICDNENITMSIYRNVQVSQNGDSRLYRPCFSNQFHIEIYGKSNNQALQKEYIGYIEEVIIIFSLLKSYYFLPLQYTPTPQKPFQNISHLFKNYSKELDILFGKYKSTKKIATIHSILESQALNSMLFTPV